MWLLLISVLLEKVFLRVGSAASDEQLEKVIATFLVPVLLKLNSQTTGVRDKVGNIFEWMEKMLISQKNKRMVALF